MNNRYLGVAGSSPAIFPVAVWRCSLIGKTEFGESQLRSAILYLLPLTRRRSTAKSVTFGDSDPGPNPGVATMLMYLVVNAQLEMSPGKMAAQVGHAVQLALLDAPLFLPGIDKVGGRWNEWLDGEYGKIVLRADPAGWEEARQLPGAVIVVDNGHTELTPGSETVICFPPMLKADRPGLLKRLRLY